MIALKSKTKLFFLVSILLSQVFQSCIEKDISQEQPDPVPTGDELFDFAMKKDITIDVNYGFGNMVNDGSYQVIFELYKEIPYEYDANGNRSKKANVQPIYSAWTNTNGRFTKDIVLPAVLTEVYLVSNHIGAVSIVQLKVENNKITFDQNSYLESLNNTTRTRADNVWTLPAANWVTLGNWNSNGMPEYLMENKQFSASFLEDMQSMFTSKDETGIEGSDIWFRHPEFFTAQGGNKTDMDIHITKATGVTMSAIKNAASFKSAVGYYIYETAKPPKTAADIKSYYITFPHVSNESPLATGSQVRLMFPGADGPTKTFPAGYSIGFFMAVNGFSAGNISAGTEICYSTRALNTVDNGVGGQRTVALFEPGTKQMIALGFEDFPSWDKDYNDALLNIFVEEPNAIKIDDMPELEPTDPTEAPQAVSVAEGVMLFEDLWPSKGDYDMNDVVVSYYCKVYRDKNNYITKVEDIFTPRWDGASFFNGFGYQYGSVTPNQVKSIEIVSSNPESNYMKGQKSEPGQSKQTIILIDNMHSVTKDESYAITTTFNNNAVADLVPPYNSFIIVHTDKAEAQRRELHLINQMPTDLVNPSDFGTKDDVSDASKGIYYIASMKYPFSLDIPKIDFRIVSEAKSIYNAYPKYGEWVESNGANAKDWYDFPQAGLVY